MQFTPKTEQEIKAASLLEDGVYDFQVVDAIEKVSSKGNEMIELQLTVFANDGTPRRMRDWILEAFAHKLRHFCAAANLMAKYDAGTLSADDCIGKCGKCSVVRKPDREGNPQNSIVDYIMPDSNTATPQPTQVAAQAALNIPTRSLAEDDIPF